MELQEALSVLLKHQQPIRCTEQIDTWYGYCFVTLFLEDGVVRAKYEKNYIAGGKAYQVDRSPLIRAAWFVGDLWRVDETF